ncbi:MAG: DUF853 family protein [Methanomicrobiales archaeon]|nr:DUF853 family protein [Methanomicrobiales archaeon]
MGVRDLLKACSAEIVLLDALYQWATTPTGYAAVRRGLLPDHTRIQQNLIVRYGLTADQAAGIYRTLVRQVEAAGLSFAGGYLDAEIHVRRSPEVAGALLAETVSRIARAPIRERSIAWLFCRLKDDYSLWPHTRDYRACQEKMHRFLAVLDATFGIPAEAEEVFLALIRLGLVNELPWVSAAPGGSRRENELVFPSYLGDGIPRHLEAGLPDPPDPSAFLDRLLADRRGDALAALEGLAERGWMDGSEMPWEVPLHPCVVGRHGGVLAVNWRLRERLRRGIAERKRTALAEAERIVAPALPALLEQPLPEPIEGGDGMRVWRTHASGRPIAVALAPWFALGDMERLRASPSPSWRVAIASLLSASDLERLHQEVCCGRPGGDWIFVALSREGVTDRVCRDCPPAYARFVDRLRRGDLGRGQTAGDPPLSVFLGRSSRGEEVRWRPGDLQNGHVLIVGGTGAGKTETIRCIAAELARQGYPLLLIDFHGDMALDVPDQRTCTIREDAGYCFNPLELDPALPEITPLRATSDFVDAISINFPTLGIQQREQLKQFIRRAYRRCGITGDPATWGGDLDFASIEDEMQGSAGRTARTLAAYLADAFQYRLFSGEKRIEVRSVLRGGITRLNLRALPESLRFLYADLFLRKLYYALQSMGEIPRAPAGDRERFRLFVVVDEAKLLVSERQGIKAVLNKYASELRKFGVGLILASQLVGHFPEEVLANIEVKVCMKAQNGDQARRNARFFGIPDVDLLELERGEGILILGRERQRLYIVPSWERTCPAEKGQP